jgi:DNA end-binding protein Ku
MARAIWKGAISFGLVHIPVALYPAASEGGIDFDWIDKRSFDPVGYKRVNKRTGKEIARADIVKGIKQADGEYVVLSEDEIRAAYPKTTQTIAIEAFVKAPEVSFTLLESPYFLEPVARGEKAYALLREAMLEAGVIGIARVVMHTKEHLCALVPTGPALMLNTLRWGREIRPVDDLKLPAEGKRGPGIKEGELKMARHLIDDMTEPFHPERFDDQFTQAVMRLVEQRVASGQTKHVEPMEEGEAPKASNVVDLTELLAQSLRKAPASKTTTKSAARKTAGRKTAHAKRAA